MTRSASARRRKKRSGRKPSRKSSGFDLRSLFFILLAFGGLTTAALLIAPPWGLLSSGFDADADLLPSAVFRSMGLLALFIPAALIMAAWLVVFRRPNRQAPYVLLGLFATLYFLFAVVHLLVPRLSLDIFPFPGGRIASGITAFLESSTGPVLAFLILMTAFVTSLVILTGWDLVADFQSLSRKLARLFSSLAELTVERRRARAPGGEPSVSPGSPGMAEAADNPWDRESSAEDQVAVLPFDRQDEVPSASSTGSARASRAAASKASSRQTSLDFDDDEDGLPGRYVLPSSDLLAFPPTASSGPSQAELRERGDLLVAKLADFGISCEVAGHFPGPVITRYELRPGQGVKINRILGLADDLALALKAKRIRILAPIPGKGAVGIEIPNARPEIVYLREVLQSIQGPRPGLPLALGKSLEGKPFVTDLCRMPHVLIAGATGSGKSVCIHSIIASLIMRLSPLQVRLVLVDPKMLELSVYQDIPHLWSPVIVEAKKAHFILEKLVEEMEGRYRRLARAGVRSIAEFNGLITPESEDERMPYIVLIIDELADLMVVCASEVEQPVMRLAQMARAVGIHLVLATQRPSVDVITGLIKANFPARIAFNVQSKTDSRTVLDMNGAEKLLGNGDMLFLPPSSPEPIRIHGSYLTTEEARRIVEHWAAQPGLPMEHDLSEEGDGNIMEPGEIELDDPLLEQARMLVIRHQQGSVSLLQRRLRVGYSRAARLIDMLEQMGVVGEFQGSKARDVLVPPPEAGVDPVENGEEGKTAT